MCSFPLVTILVAFGMLLSSAIIPFQLNSIYADGSETNTEQGLRQENIRSGESINTNCGENTIDSSSMAVCGGSSTGPGGPPGGANAFTVEDCLELSSESFRCNIIDPPGLRGPLNCGFFPIIGISSYICNPRAGHGGTINALSCEAPDFSLGRQSIECFEIVLPLPV
jgi:hypothetical protein